MTIKNSQIRAKARYLLDENIFGKDWLKSIVVNFITIAIMMASGGVLYLASNMFLAPFIQAQVYEHITQNTVIISIILGILEVLEFFLINILFGPLSVGLAAVHLDLVRGDGNIKIRKFFSGFRHLIDNFQIGFMYMLHIFLWTMLFIIPGIYVSYSYAMAFYVKKDNPEYRWQQCLDESERLMEGNRWRFFKLQISFIGWSILGTLALCGLGSLWVAPYQAVSGAVFYDTIKNEKHSNEVSFDPKKKNAKDPLIVDLSNKKGLLKTSAKKSKADKK